LHEAAVRLTVYLASDRPVVYAKEAVYGAHPFLEAASLGKPNALMPTIIPRQILEFNSKQPTDKKILMTALDVEHSIEITKKKRFVFYRN